MLGIGQADEPDVSSKVEMTPIFILSQPRAGSTLLQRLIAADESVATTSEPWLLLPFLYTLRDRGVVAEFDYGVYRLGLGHFIQELPGGRATYVDAIRLAASALYGAFDGNGKRYFLDKTPRYALVALELCELFPDARFVFLWRHPLAVVGSHVETFGRGRWGVHRWRVDLFDGLERLVAAFEALGSQACAVRYEDLVSDPDTVLRTVYEYLGLSLNEDRIRAAVRDVIPGPLGDPTGQWQMSEISSESIGRWKAVLGSSIRRRWCLKYVDWVGDRRLEVMGYSAEDIRQELSKLPHIERDLGSDVVSVTKGRVLQLLTRLPSLWH